MGMLEKIMRIGDPNRKEIELRKYASKLGCSLSGTYVNEGRVHLEQEFVGT